MRNSRRFRTTKTTAATAGCVVLAAIISACSSSGGGSSSGGSSGGGLTKITMAPSHLTSSINIAAVAAVQDGMFNKCGFDVSVKEGGGGGDTIRTVTTGAAQFAIPSTSAALQAYLQGADIEVVSGEGQGTAGMAFLVQPGSTLKSVKDLAGKKIGVSAAGSNSDTELRAILDGAGVPFSSVKEVGVGNLTAGLAALSAGVVAATYATAPQADQLQTEGKARILVTAQQYIPYYQSAVIVTSGSYDKSNPGVVKKFVNCLNQANNYALANPGAAAKAFATYTKTEESTALAGIQALADPKGQLTVNITVPGLKETIRELASVGTLPAGTSLDKFKGLFALPAGGDAALTGGSL